MSKKAKTPAYLLAQLHRQMQRPNQGPAEGPYWIVMNLSQHKSLHYRPPAFPFRHPTEEAAVAEAHRLSQQPDHAGWRFGVFAFTGISVKVEVFPVADEPARAQELQDA